MRARLELFLGDAEFASGVLEQALDLATQGASGLILEAGPWLDSDRIFANYRDGPYSSSPWAPHPNLTHVPLSLPQRATGARQL